jgi:hypothetical protein
VWALDTPVQGLHPLDRHRGDLDQFGAQAFVVVFGEGLEHLA